MPLDTLAQSFEEPSVWCLPSQMLVQRLVSLLLPNGLPGTPIHSYTLLTHWKRRGIEWKKTGAVEEQKTGEGSGPETPPK